MQIENFQALKNVTSEVISYFKSKNNLALYGCGKAMPHIMRCFNEHGVFPVAICDSNPSLWGEVKCGLSVMSIENALKMHEDLKIFISAPSQKQDIFNYLIQYLSPNKLFSSSCELYDARQLSNYQYDVLANFEKYKLVYEKLADEKSRMVMENAIKGWITCDLSYFASIYEGDQYFPSDIIALSDNESFVDCGAFVGGVFRDFHQRVNGNFSAYYAFEPVPDAFAFLSKAVNGSKGCLYLYNKGVSDRHASLRLSIENSEYGKATVSETGEVEIEVFDIDSVISEPVSYIKMDIEGSELDALKGAEKTIRKNKPKLAICVYHKNDDLIEIPKYLDKLDIGYRLYLRHHTWDATETVLYAI